MNNGPTVFTSELLWRLADIGKHLRDCTEDIVKFSNIFGDQLVAAGESEIQPKNFVLNWIIARRNFAGRTSPERAGDIEQKMPMFAEDLCGKEFAAEVQLIRSQIYPPFSIERERQRLSASAACYPFLPEKPVMVTEAEQGIPQNDDGSRQTDWAGFTKLGERQPETPTDEEEFKPASQLPPNYRFKEQLTDEHSFDGIE
ncbi:MAG: hypothetical protein Q7S83_01060 [bacterium]|nr:hypothetical protein [bacterium]